MKRKYKLIIIIIICSLLTYLIYFFCKEDKLKIVVLGDGISSGETFYKIDGISYNDYLKDYYLSKNLLKKFNNNYSFKNYSIDDMTDDLKSNILDEEENLYIKQILHQADIITLCIGQEELMKLSMTNDLNDNEIKDLIKKYDNLIYMLKTFTDAKIIIIGFFENDYIDKSSVIILNSEISNISIKYNCIFVNIDELLKNEDYFNGSDKSYFNYKAHRVIAEMIVHSV